jgi:ABC-type branched-subunit amino acid transport system ATPase component
MTVAFDSRPSFIGQGLAQSTDVLLELKQVTKSFGGLHCINDLDIEVHQGEILSVIGPNGAG